jgi:hypothetical protein
LEKLYKNFIEELIDLNMDPEDNELSDSEEEDKEEEKQKLLSKEGEAS